MAVCVRANCDYMLYLILSLSSSTWIMSNHLSVPGHHTSFSQAGTSFVLMVALNTLNEMPRKKVLRPDSVKFSRTSTKTNNKQPKWKKNKNKTNRKIWTPALYCPTTDCRRATPKFFSLKKKQISVPVTKHIFLPLGFSPGEFPGAALPATLLWEQSRAGSIHLFTWHMAWLLASFAVLISKKPPNLYRDLFFPQFN